MKIPRAQARGIFALILVVALLAGIPVANYLVPKVIKRFTPKVVATDLSSPPSASEQYELDLERALKVRALDPDVVSRLASVTNRTQIYRNGCHGNQKNPVPTLPCAFGDRAAGNELWLLGDSHAAQWFTPLNYLAKRHHLKLVVRTMSSCPFLSGIPTLDDPKTNYWQCRTHNHWLLGQIAKVQPKFIVVSGYLGIEAKNIDATISGLKSLAGRGSSVIVLGDTPKPRGSAPDCLSNNKSSIQKCAASKTANQAKLLRSKITAVANKFGFNWVDPTTWLCKGEICPAVIAGRIIYADNTHISTEAQHYLVGRIEALLGLIVEN